MTLRDQIRDYVHSSVLSSERRSVQIEDNASMIKSGLINSMAVVDIIAYLENNFRISIADRDINIDDFDSIDSICSLVARRQAKAS